MQFPSHALADDDHHVFNLFRTKTLFSAGQEECGGECYDASKFQCCDGTVATCCNEEVGAGMIKDDRLFS